MNRNLLLCFRSASAAILLGLCACADVEFYDNGQIVTGPPSLSSSAEENRVEFDRQTFEQSIQIYSNSAWTALSDQKWCTVNPPSNRGDSRLLITVKANTSIAPRTAFVTVKADAETLLLLTVEQQGLPLVPVNEFDVGVALDRIPLPIYAEGGWTATVTEGGSWCTLLSESGEGYFENALCVTTNDEGAPRTATVRIVCGESEDTVTLTQRAELERPAATYGGEADFRLSWEHVYGAKSYRIVAETEDGTSFGEEVKVVTGQTTYTYDLARLHDLEGYIGRATVNVRALTNDPDVTTISELSAEIHTLFDATSGDGSTLEQAYRISQPRHLRNLALTADSYAYYRQIADIDLTGYDGTDPAKGPITPIAVMKGHYTGERAPGVASKISHLSLRNPAAANGSKTALFASFQGDASREGYLGYVELEEAEIEVTASSTAAIPTAGLIADGSFVRIEHCTLSGGRVTGANCNQVAGIIANCGEMVSITRCSSSATVSGNNNVAAISGNGGPSIAYCSNRGTITGNSFVGGIAGTMNAAGLIDHCCNTGSVSITGSGSGTPVGGIAGRLMQNNGAHISCSFNSGDVSATHTTNSGQAGGIVGVLNSSNTVKDCYNSGTVTSAGHGAASYAGGICGQVNNTAGIIGHCYNVGSVTSGNAAVTGAIGGFVGNENTEVLDGCFYLQNDTLTGMGTGNDAGSEAKSAAEMADLTTYDGWDTSLWQIGGGEYPYPQIVGLPHTAAGTATK